MNLDVVLENYSIWTKRVKDLLLKNKNCNFQKSSRVHSKKSTKEENL